MEKYKVCIECFTFNQKKYIKSALDSFIMQKTNFPFVICLVDDNSNDEDKKYIREYVNENFINLNIKENDKAYVMSGISAKNNNCHLECFLLKQNMFLKREKIEIIQEIRSNSQYLSICEGDDYFLSEYKLQKQANFLDENTDFACVFHATKFEENGQFIKEKHTYNSNTICNIVDQLQQDGDFMTTNSIMYNIKKCGNSWYDWLDSCAVGDFPMQLDFFTRGKVYYMDEVLSTYRVNAEGSWSLNKNFKNVILSTDIMFEHFDKYTNYHYHDIIENVRKKRKHWIGL